MQPIGSPIQPPTPKPPLYKRKLFWTGVIVVLSGIVASVFDGWEQGMGQILQGLQTIFGGN